MKQAGTPHITVSSPFLLLAAILYFFDDSGLLSAIVPAVVLHELSHLLALRCMGASVTRISVSITGLCMDYCGTLTEKEEALAALAGPVGGLLGAVLCSVAGTIWNSPFWSCCAGVGMILSGFNLLPALPLDGGRALFCLVTERRGTAYAVRILNGFGIAVSSALLIAGLVLMLHGYGAAVAVAGFWILVLGVGRTPEMYNRKTGSLSA